MADWLGAILALLTLVNKVLAYAERREAEGVGRAAAVKEAFDYVGNLVVAANELRATLSVDLNGRTSDGLRSDDDPYRRD